MSIRTIATLAVAILLGLVAVVVLNVTLGKPRGAQQAALVAGTPVVVAAQPIARGATLQPALLKVVMFPQGSVPPLAFSNIEQLTGAANVQRVAMRTFAPGEPVLQPSLSGPGGRLNLSSEIAPGMQAVAIRASDVSGVGGFVIPGDRVDVLLTRSIGGGEGGQATNTVTQIVAENVRVVGVDQSDNDESDKPSVAKAVTVEVTPTQAQTITLGQSVGTVSLTLRHVADDALQAQRATTVGQLGFAAPTRRPAAAAMPAAAKGPATTPLYGPGVVRVTRVTDTTPYRVSER